MKKVIFILGLTLSIVIGLFLFGQKNSKPVNNLSTTSEIIILNDKNFDSQISGNLILVDFWAPWCAPCRMMHPILEEIAKENKGKIKVAKVNIDDFPQYAQKYIVQGIPTLILFNKSKESKRIVGYKSKDEIIRQIINN